MRTQECRRAGATCLLRPFSCSVLDHVAGTGETARHAAKHRPTQPIVALTGYLEICRRLALVRGVLPLLCRSRVRITRR